MGFEDLERMPQEEVKPGTPEEEELKSQFFVGARENPDGTMDYSRAGELVDPEGKLAKGVEELEERKRQERAEKLKIPADAKPGTSYMVEHDLRNAIFINEESAEKARERGEPTDKRREGLIKKLRTEESMLGSRILRVSLEKRIRQEVGGKEREELTDEQIRKRMREFPAVDMYGLIQEFFVDYCQKLMDEEGESARFLRNTGHTIEEELSAAMDLQDRLNNEAARGGDKKE